jgi:type IV pilus assembly protein PilN
MVALAVLAIALVIDLRIMSKRVNAAESQMRELKTQSSVLANERHANEARMRQPQNQAVLERSRLLNEIFERKSFSWTAVMMDLENVLPTGVQVTSIDPQVTPTGDVIIRLRVSGDRDRAVQLVRNLEHSRRFLQPHLSSEASQAKTTTAANGGLRQPQINGPTAPPGVEFDILAIYNPLPEGEPYAPAKHVGARATRGVGR